jgi:hypothetical protein
MARNASETRPNLGVVAPPEPPPKRIINENISPRGFLFIALFLFAVGQLFVLLYLVSGGLKCPTY